jgi:hypothetical protein
MRFSKLSFRVILILVCMSFLPVCASARSKASLPGAVIDSEGLVFDVQLEVNAVKEQVEAISIWNALRREDASSPATITSQQI